MRFLYLFLFVFYSLGFAAEQAEQFDPKAYARPVSAVAGAQSEKVDAFSVPTGPVWTVQQQQDAYVAAYDAVGGGATVHPLETPVPGLSPLVENFYRFATQMLGEKQSVIQAAAFEELQGDLRHLWGQVAPMVAKESMTVAQLKCIASQLSVFFTAVAEAEQSTGFFTEVSIYSRPHWLEGKWKNLSTWRPESFYIDDSPYSDEKIYVAPGFGCEAILCHRDGGFSYDRFNNNYLGRNYPLFISALAFDMNVGKGPHGDFYPYASAFFEHEFSHFDDFVRDYLRALTAQSMDWAQANARWNKIKGVLGKVHENKSRVNQIGLFVLMHELARSDVFFGVLMDDNMTDAQKFYGLVKLGQEHRQGSLPNSDPDSYSYDPNFNVDAYYSRFYADEARMLKFVYGDAFSVPENVTSEEKVVSVQAGLTKLWSEFEAQNRGLFQG